MILGFSHFNPARVENLVASANDSRLKHYQRVMPISLGDVGIFASVSLVLLYILRKRKIYSAKEYRNPGVQELKRLQSHAILGAFNSEDLARCKVCQPQCSPFVKVLSGNWLFKLLFNVDAALALVEQGVDVETLTSVSVPGHWQLQVPGDAPIYT